MEIYVLNKQFDILGAFSTYEGIVWNPKLHEPGIFKASFIFTEKMNCMLQRGNLLYKTDEDEPGIITRKYLRLNKNGEETIQVEGYMASRYLNRRIIWNKMILKGTPEEVMRRMVHEQIISPAISERKIDCIELGEFNGYDGNIEKQVTYDNLQESLTEVSKLSELGYRLRLDYGRRKLIFEVYKGEDRTQGTEEPCVFSRDFGNVYTQEYSEDESNYKNICPVGGPGEDPNRILRTVGSGPGLDRYEMFYNASGISDRDISTSQLYAQMDQKGKEKLSAYYVAQAFQSKINKDKAMYFQLGDYVTCVDKRWSVMENKQVKEIIKGFSKTEQSFVATFGDGVPTLIGLIKAKE